MNIKINEFYSLDLDVMYELKYKRAFSLLLYKYQQRRKYNIYLLLNYLCVQVVMREKAKCIALKIISLNKKNWDPYILR